MSTSTLDDVDVQQSLQASIPQGLNQDDNATLLQSIFLNDWNQRMAMRRQAIANHYGVPGVPTGSGITVCHNHNYPAPTPPAPAPDQPSVASRLAGPALIGLAGITGALGGAGLLSMFKPDMPAPAPIITPTSTSTTTTTTQAPPLLPPAPANPNYKIGVE